MKKKFWTGRLKTILIIALVVAICAAVLVLGTLVTGSGPHSGDKAVDNRLPFELRTVAWLHADLVMLFVGLIVAMWLVLRVTDGEFGVLVAQIGRVDDVDGGADRGLGVGIVDVGGDHVVEGHRAG